MSSIKDKSYYRFYCVVNASQDFKNVSLFSNIVDSHDISIVSKPFNSVEDCVLLCANFVKKAMSEVNDISGNNYKLLWDVPDKKDLTDAIAQESTVAKFYLVKNQYLGKSLHDIPTSFSASVMKIKGETTFSSAENSFSEKNYLN